ncbi:MAG TPA: transketolase [Atribacteraceae bacterium]|nr:transketolase [Atribacteraceae bacterium]
MNTKIDELCVTALRMLALDTVQKAKSGHPGMPLGAAPMAYVLFRDHLKYNPRHPRWFDRDHFILSAGHGSALLYSLLHLSGYEKMTLDQLKNFRQWGSATPGHPEHDIDFGIETTTGPLGQGFVTGVGMAIAEAHLAARFNRTDYRMIDHHTYAIVSDGDLMEGVTAEAASLAGHLRLGKLVYLFDNNSISLAGETALCFTEDIGKRFNAYGWQVIRVEAGNDLNLISRAITEAREELNRPSLIMVTTHIGFGSPKQDTFDVHGSPLKSEEVLETKRFFGWPDDRDFFIPDEVPAHFQQSGEKGAVEEARWKRMLERYTSAYPAEGKELQGLIENRLPEGWEKDLPVFPADPKGMATRKAGGLVMNALAQRISALMGGSADLDPSTNTVLKDQGSFQAPGQCHANMQGVVSGPLNYAGRNIAFGVREHAMGGILNGIATHGGLIPFGATFFVFSDYMKPSIRLAALSGCHVVYIFTHDSVGLGEDGPTHQPIEHLAAFRSVPNLLVIRPADANEAAEAWRTALKHQNGPVAIILSRQDLPILDRSRFAPAQGLQKGAYILTESSPKTPDIILVATGSEVHPTLEAFEKLSSEGFSVRLVNMPSWELFEAQSIEYRDSVLPPGPIPKLAVEAGASLGWHKYIGERGDVVAIDRFGASAPGSTVLSQFGFTVDQLVIRAKILMNKE